MSDINYKKFPYEIKELTPEESKEIGNYIKDSHLNQLEYIRVGPKGYLLPKLFMATSVYNFPVKPTDIFVASFPKSGTTWTQDLVWLLENDLDYEKAKSIMLNERFPFLGMSMLTPAVKETHSSDDSNNERMNAIKTELVSRTVEDIQQLPSPRFIKTHLPMSLLPPKLLDTAKMVFVARDPRDVAVSYYHLNILMKFLVADSEFKAYWKLFIKDKVLWSPYFGTVLEAWKQRNHPNMLFLFYEELSKDLPAVIRRVAKFLGKELTDDQVAGLNEHLKFDNFKNNKSVNLTKLQDVGVFKEGDGHIRKGKVGGWRDYFDEEMTEEARKWIADNLRGTDFRFTHF